MGAPAVSGARNPPRCRGPEDERRRLGGPLGPLLRPRCPGPPASPAVSSGGKSLTVKPLGPDDAFADYSLAPPGEREGKGRFLFSFSPWQSSLRVG